MPLSLSPFAALALGGLVAALLALATILASRRVTGSYGLAAALSGGFAAFTAVTIANEGVATVWANHTSNLWGVQVWWDLLISVVLALFFLAPRARAVGMSLPLWALFVAATASIGLLAMAARVFWLESHRGEADSAAPSRPVRP